jgi:hypothetical protein
VKPYPYVVVITSLALVLVLIVACIRDAQLRPLAKAEPAGSTVPAPPPPAPVPPFTPEFGSVLVIVRTAEGLEYTVMCGGDVSFTAPDGRTLLRLDRP